MFSEKVHNDSGWLSIRGTSEVSARALLLFGGELEVLHAQRAVTVDGWIRVEPIAPKTAVLFKRLRQRLQQLLQLQLESTTRGAGQPGAIGMSAEWQAMLDAVRQLLRGG